MSDIKSFWISVLESTRLLRPLPLPHRTDLTTLDLDSLRGAAYHALRLNHNWTSSRPRYVGIAEDKSFGESLDMVCIVPGANVVMLFDSPHLIFYDSAMMMRVATLHVGNKYCAVSRAYYETPGQLLVAVATSNIQWVV